MRINISSDMRVSKGIAMALAPFDTGNLRFNAIKSVMTNNGFRIRYSLADAFYTYFLEEGTRKTTRHKGFIGNRTVPTIASYLYSKYEKPNKSKTSRFQYVSRKAQTDMGINEQRNLQNQQSLALDVKQIALEKKWKHDMDNDVFDSNFKERSL